MQAISVPIPVLLCLKQGYTVIVADNLFNSKAETIEKVKQITGEDIIFYQIDVTDEAVVKKVFSDHDID